MTSRVSTVDHAGIHGMPRASIRRASSNCGRRQGLFLQGILSLCAVFSDREGGRELRQLCHTWRAPGPALSIDLHPSTRILGPRIRAPQSGPITFVVNATGATWSAAG